MSILVNPALGATQKRYPAYKGGASAYYVDLTIDRTEVDGDVTDFPLCIQGNEMPAGFWSHVGDGTDILVTDVRSGRVLRKEIELLDKTGGSEKLAVHSKVPFIGTGYDQVLRIYYGGSMTQADTDWAVWDSGYAFVSHMADYNAGTQIKDSTKNRNHGTKGAGAAAPTEVAGTVGRAQRFPGDQANYIALASPALGAGNELTILALYKRNGDSGGTNVNEYHTIVSYIAGAVTASHGRLLTTRAASNPYSQLRVDSTTSVASMAGGSATEYATVGMQYDNTNVSAIVNGVMGGSVARTGNYASGTTATVIGQNGIEYWPNGDLCELRLSRVARSAEWIALEHKTLLTPTTLYGISAEVAL